METILIIKLIWKLNMSMLLLFLNKQALLNKDIKDMNYHANLLLQSSDRRMRLADSRHSLRTELFLFHPRGAGTPVQRDCHVCPTAYTWHPHGRMQAYDQTDRHRQKQMHFLWIKKIH